MEYPQLEEEEDRLKSNHQLKEYLILVQVDDAVTEETEGVAVGTEGVAVGTEGVVVGTEGVAVGTEGVVVGTEGVAVGTEGVVVSNSINFLFCCVICYIINCNTNPKDQTDSKGGCHNVCQKLRSNQEQRQYSYRIHWLV